MVRQAVGRVVGDADRVVDVVVADHAEDRAEDLVSGCGVVVVGQVEDRRLEVVAPRGLGRPAAAEHDLGAVLLGQGDVALATIARRRVDQGPDHHARIVGRIHIFDLERSLAVDLDDRLGVRPRIVIYVRRHRFESAGL